MADFSSEDLAHHKQAIEQSRSVLAAAQRFIRTIQLPNDSSHMDPSLSVPYQPSTAENAPENPTPAPPSPTRSDENTQERIKSLLSRHISKRFNTESSKNIISIEPEHAHDDTQEITIKPPTNDTEANEGEEVTLLKDSEVITEPIAPSEDKFLSVATISYPIPIEGGDPFMPRNLAEEGHWIQEIPNHKPSNVERIENRLLWVDPSRQHYFGSDGHIRHDTPGVSEIAPPFPVEPPKHDGADMMTFRSAQEDDAQEQSTTREMVFDIRGVKFLVHSLSSEEDIESARLTMAYKAYVDNIKADKSRYYKKRIMSLHNQLKEDLPEELRKEVLAQLIECYELNDQESSFTGSLRDEMIKVHHKLKDARKESNFQSTPCQLRWQKHDPSPEEVKRNREKLEESIKNRAEKMAELEHLCGREADTSVIISEIKDRRKKLCLKEPEDPEWHPVFTNDMQITPNDQVPTGELERRTNIGNTQITLRIIVQNQTEASKYQAKMNSKFEALFNKSFEIKTTRLMPSITIEIGEIDYKKKERKLAKIAVPVYVGEPPEYFNYEFTSEFQLETGNIIMGSIDARVYVKPDATQEFLLTIPNSNNRDKKRLISDPSQFVSVPRMLEATKKMDQNDPYITANLSTVMSNRAKERVDKKFKLDAAIDSVSFNSFVSQNANFQHSLKYQRLLEEREKARRKERGADDDKYLAKLKGSKVVREAVVNKSLQLSDVVRETPLPVLDSLFTDLLAHLFTFRQLKPRRKERVPSQNIQEYSKIIIRLSRGSFLPKRSLVGTGPMTNSTLIYSAAKGEEINTFARISFNNEVQKSYPVSGETPEWNQTFIFNISKDKNETPTIEELAKKDIRIDVFDRLIYDIVEDDRQSQTTHSVNEDRFISSLTFPVETLWASGKVDGVLTLDTPPFLLGYDKTSEPVKINVFFTIEPPLIIPDVVSERDSAEKTEIKLHAEKWMNKMRDNTFAKNRLVKVMATPTNGLPILICRMITPQNLPEGYMHNDRQKIARFVSLFPNVSDSSVFGTTRDVWCSSQEFLKMKAGDEEEHASLLCNYFKFMGLDAYIVFGFTIDNGKSAYVLTRETTQFTLCDPLTGRFFNSKDRSCPMYSVGCVANETNIWANIQEQAEPWIIDWNFSNTGYWHPFFSSDFPLSSFDSPQEKTLHYKPAETSVSNRERAIEAKIKREVERCRDQQRTNWNLEFSSDIKKILKKCEACIAENGNDDFRNNIEELQQQFPSYRMYGTPFFVPFKNGDDFQNVIDEIKKQEIYRIENPRAEFGLAVYVVPYPNEISAIWVMLAVIENIRPGGRRL